MQPVAAGQSPALYSNHPPHNNNNNNCRRELEILAHFILLAIVARVWWFVIDTQSILLEIITAVLSSVFFLLLILRCWWNNRRLQGQYQAVHVRHSRNYNSMRLASYLRSDFNQDRAVVAANDRTATREIKMANLQRLRHSDLFAYFAVLLHRSTWNRVLEEDLHVLFGRKVVSSVSRHYTAAAACHASCVSEKSVSSSSQSDCVSEPVERVLRPDCVSQQECVSQDCVVSRSSSSSVSRPSVTDMHTTHPTRDTGQLLSLRHQAKTLLLSDNDPEHDTRDTQDTGDTSVCSVAANCTDHNTHNVHDLELGEVHLSPPTRSNVHLYTATQHTQQQVCPGSRSPSSTSRKTSRSNSFTSVIADFFFGGFNNAHNNNVNNVETAFAVDSGKCRDTVLDALTDMEEARHSDTPVEVDADDRPVEVELELEEEVEVEVDDKQLEVDNQQRQTDDKDNDDSDNLCSICLEVATRGEVLVTIPVCRHRFHETCLLTWFLRSMHLSQQQRGTNYDLFLFHVPNLSSNRSNVPEHSGCVCPLCKQDVARLCVAATEEQDTAV